MRLTPIQQNQIKTFKALSDGTRLKMISNLHRAMTVKQLADLIGEDHHKLYHHMRVLEGAGIVQLVETRTDSHIVEKYYQLIDNKMVLQTQHFSPEHFPVLNGMILDLAQTCVSDLIECSKHGKEKASASRIVLNVRPDKFEEVRETVQKHVTALLRDLSVLEEETAESAYQLLVLHFPVTEAADPAAMGQEGSAVRKGAKKKVAQA